jgi:hypothetical protein
MATLKCAEARLQTSAQAPVVFMLAMFLPERLGGRGSRGSQGLGAIALI